MREFKFRAWDTDSSDWLDEEVYSLSIGLGGGVWLRVESEEWLDAGQRIMLMQYTGLTDKNGKPIYEGDIVTFGTLGNGEVVFAKYITDNEANEDILGWCFMTNQRYHALDPQATFEVIGNIWENGDLLK